MRKAHKYTSAFLAGLVLLLTACTSPSLIPTDTSMEATEARDKTLVMSACETAPSRGMDVCRFVEGSSITSKWTLIMPWEHSTRGTVRVRYRDRVMSYEVSGPTLDIYWADVMGAKVWQREHDGLVQALGEVTFTDWNGSVVSTKVLGYAYVIILKPGYTPLYIDSGDVHPFKTSRCVVIYTEKGRSQVQCSSF